MPDNSAEIAKLKAILDGAASAVSNDGTSVTFDLEAARRRLQELQAQDTAQQTRRPRAATIWLGGF